MEFRLRLEDRRADRVYVAVCLAPDTQPGAQVESVDGVAVELRGRGGQPLSCRLMVPVAGPIRHPLTLHTEIRAMEDIPRGATVVGTAWTAAGTRECSCPADPGTALEAYAKGAAIHMAPPDHAAGPEDLTTAQHRAMARAFPWMAHFKRPGTLPDDDGILEEHSDDVADNVADRYNLCDEDKELLRELLSDDDADEAGDAELEAMLRELDDDGTNEDDDGSGAYRAV